MSIASLKKVQSTETHSKRDSLDERDLPAVIKSASRVIAPLHPISAFVARHPWAEMEKQSFDEVAGWLKRSQHVDIYPSFSMIHSAKERGEIDDSSLRLAVRRWLNSSSFTIPWATAEKYCLSAVTSDSLPSDWLLSESVKQLAEEISGLDTENIKQHSMQPLSSWVEDTKGTKLIHVLNRHIIKWCKLYIDDFQAGWTMPYRKKGLYYAWYRLVQKDPALTAEQRKRLKQLPNEAHSALIVTLSDLGISGPEVQRYIETHLLSLPGWAGAILWRTNQSDQETDLLTEYVAVRIAMEWALLKPFLPVKHSYRETRIPVAPLLASWFYWGDLTPETWAQMSAAKQNEYLSFAYRFDENTRKKIWLEAWEQTYADQLNKKITTKNDTDLHSSTALAQFAFCIDVRSEPFRRHLEKEGPFETIGTAGFFGLPIKKNELGSSHSHPSLPVILEPQHQLKEKAGKEDYESFQKRNQAENSLSYTFKIMKQNILASLLLPEVSGPWLSLHMFARSFLPRKTGSALRKLRNDWLRKPETEITLDHEKNENIPIGFNEEEKVDYVLQSLKMMGLTENFSPLVVICGHGSQTTNNPYASSLDCGACGGASGGFNARVLATLCNLTEVREALSHKGIHIPEETVFAAAEHNTTVDTLTWIYVPELSEAAKKAFDRIESAMPKVSYNANADRMAELPHLSMRVKNPQDEAQRLAEDWSEIRPEWGLARNASFIIGERELTKNCNLEGRAFLHNYHWEKDENGEILANIINGPGTVAQWINLQYYASTVAPHYYGSGNKTTQTITAGMGVMQGNASDLLIGLPWQSVMRSDSEPYHSPIRLLVVIHAPNEYINRLLSNNESFREKVQNGWIKLSSIDPEGYWKNW
ncbi:DUF2309 domain-containing protein [Alteribacillus iranensis]|nr:putative inorganic carbon transporter subunit DabA [Alteribacillus iranensis]